MQNWRVCVEYHPQYRLLSMIRRSERGSKSSLNGKTVSVGQKQSRDDNDSLSDTSSLREDDNGKEV